MEAAAAAAPPAPPPAPQLAPPGKFDFTDANEWPRWMKRFERYRIASGLDKQSEEFQVNAFMYAAGDDAEDILNVLPLTDAEKKSYKRVTEAFNAHCVSKRNIIFERACFNRRSQEPGESVESFITAVHTLAEHCEFGVLREELIRDRIVVGIRDARLSESLQLDAALTLEKAITRVKQSAAVKKQQPVIRGTEQATGQVEVIYKKTSRGQKEKNDTQSSGCGRCGHSKKHLWKDCPARDAECRKCHKKGHFAKTCRSGSVVHDITQVQMESNENEDFAFLGEMCSKEPSEWIELLRLNGDETIFKLDTGAEVTAIPSSMHSIKKHGTLQSPPKVLYGPGRHKLDVKGCFKGKLTIKERATEQLVYAVGDLSKPLLGLPAIEALKLISRLHTVEGKKEDVKTQYPTVKQKADPVCAKLISYCKTEWPEKHALPPDLGPYWPERESLTVAGELLLRGQRIVVPHCMRQEILHDLHSGHQGIVKCRARARQSVWWPGLSVHISQMVENCSTCSQHKAEHREPLLTTPVQDRPWQRVGTDLFFWEKKTYLLIVDYFSRYLEVAHLYVASSETVVAALKDVFGRHGVPETVMSDNGPQYSGAPFKAFATEYGFTHITSSPRYPQANGEAERAVATVKGLWKGGGEKAKALLSYRATPLESGYSPAQLLMGRQIRSTIPQLPTSLRPRWPNVNSYRKSEKQAKKKQQQRYNLRHRARPLHLLQPGQNVWLPRENKKGTVIQHATTPRSYIIHTDEGQVRRNRTHMRAIQHPQPCQTTPDTPDKDSEPGNTDTLTPVIRETIRHTITDGTNTPYVTFSGRASRPPVRLDL
ncbi:hypothetical protein N1851_022770 [Merluccius polli]|uniref:Gypsy retrotransposon integrase-like protein 1 n=1 Tax=Merluccius polli TaxID=89951 RepID=A0AA47MHK6_MERPO|nr:hypothetical protein N1851_022770 [Merluccius polli]